MKLRVAVRYWVSFVLAVCVFFNCSPAWGWSAEAHQRIALIAMQRLQGTHTATRIQALMGTVVLADIAVCPDQVREILAHEITAMTPTCAAIFPTPPGGTEPRHFVNIPVKSAPYTPVAADVTAVCANRCAVVEIPKYLAVLATAKPGDTPAQKLAEKQALSFVVHFIGDVHQPLHAANCNNDGGGNAEVVSYFGNGTTDAVKPHAIWDNQMVTRIDKTDTALATDLAPEIAKAAAESQATPTDWAIQSSSHSAMHRRLPTGHSRRQRQHGGSHACAAVPRCCGPGHPPADRPRGRSARRCAANGVAVEAVAVEAVCSAAALVASSDLRESGLAQHCHGCNATAGVLKHQDAPAQRLRCG